MGTGGMAHPKLEEKTRAMDIVFERLIKLARKKTAPKDRTVKVGCILQRDEAERAALTLPTQAALTATLPLPPSSSDSGGGRQLPSKLKKQQANSASEELRRGLDQHMPFCVECGTKYDGSPKFCAECGHSVPRS